MDDLLRGLEALANVASIVTAVVAVCAGGWYLYQRGQKRLRLETYLKAETGENDELRSVIQSAAALGMTEAEIIDCAFKSRHIIRKVTPNFPGNPSRLVLRYTRSRQIRTLPAPALV